MKTILTTLLLAGLCTLDSPAQESGADVDGALVILNDQILTESKVAQMAERLMARDPEMDPQEAFGAALNFGIRRILYFEVFQDLGLDQELLDPQVDARIDEMIREDGSRQRFLERIAVDGFTSVEDFREALTDQFIEGTVAGMLSGQIPTPNKGKLQLPEPTPAAIRRAYDSEPNYRSRPAEFEWVLLKFVKDPNLAAPAERAAETMNRLRAGMISPASALAAADKVTYSTTSEGSREDLAEFLDSAQAGEIMDLGQTNSGVVRLALVTKREVAREIAFEEAQLLIKKDLRAAAGEIAVRGALSEVWQRSYRWVTPRIPGLAESLDRAFGLDPDRQKPEEL